MKNPDKEKPAAEPAAAEDVGGIIKAIGEAATAVGSLKGASLALIVGALLMFGTLWVAQSAASTPGPGPTPAPTPTSAAPAEEPGGPTPIPSG